LSSFERPVKFAPKLALESLLLIFCSGCFPYYFTTRPAATGVIVDANTRAPIAGAEVVVTRERVEGRVGKASSQSDGTFHTPSAHMLGVYIIPGDVFPFPFTLTIRHDGYQDYVQRISHRAMGDGSAHLFGEIQLESAAK
jgi:hypothetical protein